MSSRVPVAALLGLSGFIAYIAAAVVLADAVVTANWLVQGLYFLVAGSLWIFPARWLMYWAAGLR